LKIILRDAERIRLEINPYSNYIESFKQKNCDRILHVLNPKEIKVLKELQQISDVNRDSYRWLLIGLYIGQRVSDLLKLTPCNLRKASSRLFVNILQQKSKKALTVGVADLLVIKISEKESPRIVSQVVFHKQMKALCRMSKIEGLLPRFKNTPKTRRKEIVNAPKYTFVTSHIMRLSFEFNYL
jgi:integrase